MVRSACGVSETIVIKMHGETVKKDIVVCPFSTIFTTQMDWWQLINFDNPDAKFRVVRNLYIIVSICEYNNIEIEALSPRDTTKECHR